MLIVVAVAIFASLTILWVLPHEVAVRRSRSLRRPKVRHAEAAVLPARVISWLRARGPGSRKAALARFQSALDFVTALAAEMKAGQPPRTAIVRAAQDYPVCPRAVAAASMGGDVGTGLRLDGEHQGLRVLVGAAALWRVGESSGAGLASGLERLAESGRRAEQVRTELHAALSAPRATSRLLMGLPVLGIVLGVMLGADPIAWLTGSIWGWGCLLLAAAFMGIGVVWTGLIASRVENIL